MDDKELREIAQRCEAATPGPWGRTGAKNNFVDKKYSDPYDLSAIICEIWDIDSDVNADFITHAREDIPALLAEVERQNKELAALREAKQCTYKQEDYDGDIWDCSACDASLVLEAGNPHDNDMYYCPKCGAKITAISICDFDEESGWAIDKIIVRLPEAPEGGEG